MKRVITAAATAALAGVWIPTVAADDLISADMVPGKFSANVALTSEYFFRGISQTDDSPAIQGGFDWAHEGTGLYLGVWGSNIDFNTGNSIEIDIYGGIGGTINKFSWKAGGIWYAYPDEPGPLTQDYGELTASVGYDFGLFNTGFSFFYSPDFFGESGHAEYYAFNIGIPIQMFTLNLVAGRQNIEKNDVFLLPDYWHYGASISTGVAGFTLTLGVTDTDISDTDCPDLCGATVTFTVSRSF
jgi:uncharacterized protein (TIGR02001 family)